VPVLEVSVTIDNELDNLIREQSLFEDSALEDASAYARMIIKGANRFKGEKENGTERIVSTK
jgi:hypothetical protein